MDAKKCFEQSCNHEVHYVCQCSSPETYSCELHFGKHCKLPNRTHNFESIFLESCEGTKEALLGFLGKEKSKKEKLKNKILSSFSQHFCSSENCLEEYVKKLDSESTKISSCFEKISQAKNIPKQEQDPLLKLLTLQPDVAVDSVKTMVPLNSNSYNNMKLFCGLSEEIERIIECFIKEKVECFLDKRLSAIEKKLEEHDNIINGKLKEIHQLISELRNESEKNKTEFENWKDNIQQKTQNQVVVLISQLNSAVEDLENKINGISQTQSYYSFNQLLSPEELNIKRSEILCNSNNLKLEQDFRNTCALYESQSPDLALSQAYQEYMNTYHQITSLYLINGANNKTNLLIYDTETQREEAKILKTPELLDYNTCIAQLPDSELFCFGNNQFSGITLIISDDFQARVLPSGQPVSLSSAIYFNRSVYCFGGFNGKKALNLSERFDLDKNCWIKLTPMPKADDSCHVVRFKQNFLISRYRNRHLLLYSIENDFFNAIPYEFTERKRKILINAERLYLIECGNGKIYESGMEDEYDWKEIANSTIEFKCPSQAYCVYNKGAVYITNSSNKRYYKFDLNQNLMIEI